MTRHRATGGCFNLKYAFPGDPPAAVEPLPDHALAYPDGTGQRGLRHPLRSQEFVKIHPCLIAALFDSVNSALVADLIANGQVLDMKRKKPAASGKEPWRVDEPRELKRLWDARHKLSQAEFAAQYGLGTQGNFGHYLSGRRPLTLDVAEAAADHLRCEIEEFSPRLAEEKGRIATLHPWPFSRVSPARYWRLSPGQKLAVEGLVLGYITDAEAAKGPK